MCYSVCTASPDDYNAVTRDIIEFNIGDTRQTHTITIKQDELCEDERLESFLSIITLEDVSGGSVRVIQPQATVYIDDSDEPECGK